MHKLQWNSEKSVEGRIVASFTCCTAYAWQCKHLLDRPVFMVRIKLSLYRGNHNFDDSLQVLMVRIKFILDWVDYFTLWFSRNLVKIKEITTLRSCRRETQLPGNVDGSPVTDGSYVVIFILHIQNIWLNSRGPVHAASWGFLSSSEEFSPSSDERAMNAAALPWSNGMHDGKEKKITYITS